MTGFGSAVIGGFKVEIRSLNHRFLDISVRMPHYMMAHELPIREAIKRRFGRGRFDVYISADGEAGLRLNLDEEKALEVKRTLTELKERLSMPGEIDLEVMMNWRELFVTEEVALQDDRLMEALEAALSGLEAMREKEGAEITDELSERAERLGELGDKIIALAPEVREKGRQRVLERFKENLPPGEYDEGRLLQEASALIEKSDISEELSRIKNHLAHLGRILKGGGTVGRKMDFLFQELYREVNTIASKTDDYRILEDVIEMKSEIEKSREQAQNIQ